MNVCCKLHPMCYCQTLPPDDEHRARMKILRADAPRADPAQVDAEARRQTQSVRSWVIVCVAGVLAMIVVIGLLAGCRPLDGPATPAPTTSEMYTVIRPDDGTYDGN